MTLRVTVLDLETGETDEKLIPEGEYVLIVAAPCYLDCAQSSRGGRTHVLTVKGRRPDAPAVANPREAARA